MLHPIPNGDSGPSCFISVSSHRHGSRMSCSVSFHPWKSDHVTTRSRALTHVTPWPLWQGLVVVVVAVPTYVTLPQREGDWHRSGIASSSTVSFYHQRGGLGCAVLQPSHRTVLGNNQSGLAGPCA
jgi:hypothetical protein